MISARRIRQLTENSMLIEFILLLAVIIVTHSFYVAYIYPHSIEVIDAASVTGVYPARHPIVIVKDLEQEICIVLGLW